MSLTVETFERLEDAARAAGSARDARYLGGGTLLMRAINYGDQSFSRILRSTDPALRQIRAVGARVEIGAGATMADVIAARELAFLAPVARSIGGPAVRAMATVGGNLFAEHPYGDFTAALLALDGAVRVAGSGGAAGGGETPIAEFLARRDRWSGRLIASVSVARPADGEFRYRKVSRVKPKGVSVMSLSAWLPRSGGRIAGARVAYGAMGPTPLRATAVERALEGKTLDEAGIAPALAVATEGLSPPTDAIASEWWRREIAPVHLKRLLLGAAD